MRICRLLLALSLLSITGVVGLASSPAVAQDTGDYVGSTPPDSGSSVSGSESSRGGNSSTLPVTGADIVVLSVLGLASVGLGLLLVRTARGRKVVALR